MDQQLPQTFRELLYHTYLACSEKIAIYVQCAILCSTDCTHGHRHGSLL